MIGTDNLADFPSEALEPHAIDAISADDFIADTIELDPSEAIVALRRMRERFANPAIDVPALMKPSLFPLFLAASFALTAPSLAETTADSVLGTWQTGVGEQPSPDGGTAYLHVTTVFTETAQDLILEIFADPDLTMPLFKYHSNGPWVSQGASEDVPGALAVNMTNDFSRVEIFVDAPDIWAALNMAECPLEIGEAVEISDCVAGPPFTVSDCTDMDIVMIDQDGQRLRYGGGDGNHCEARPTEISEIAYFKTD